MSRQLIPVLLGICAGYFRLGCKRSESIEAKQGSCTFLLSYITLTIHKYDNYIFFSSTAIHLALCIFPKCTKLFCYFITLSFVEHSIMISYVLSVVFPPV